jgi:hypothetical protein
VDEKINGNKTIPCHVHSRPTTAELTAIFKSRKKIV